MFHICDTIVNCIVFIIAISNFGSKDIKYNSFLYTDLKPANLLNSCVNSNGFIDSVRLYIEDHVTGKKKKKNGSFTSSFPIWMCFVSFSCLIPLARSFRTMLNGRGGSTHLCLVSDLKEHHCLSPLSMMLAVDF